MEMHVDDRAMIGRWAIPLGFGALFPFNTWKAKKTQADCRKQ
jgi:hypothetical protein